MNQANRNEMETMESGFAGATFLLGMSAGIAIGVIGTIIFAAYSEERFGQVIRTTRNMGDKAQETAGQLKDTVTDKFGDVADTAKKKIQRLTGKLEEQLDNGAEAASI